MHQPLNTGHTTHPALHLRDAADAHIVFEAVRLRLLPLIKRRLTSEERDQLSSGNIFVWEEAEHKGGLERWTDGRRWSQSRMKGEYLFYEEKVETTEEEKQAKAARRAHRNSSPIAQPLPPTRRQDRPAKPDGLTKQTYSTHVYMPGSSSPRKWHIVAYFSGNDYQRLPVVESYDYLRNIRIPDGVFFSNKGAVKRVDPSPGRYLLAGGSGEHHEDASRLPRDGPSLTAAMNDVHISHHPHVHHAHHASLERDHMHRPHSHRSDSYDPGVAHGSYYASPPPSTSHSQANLPRPSHPRSMGFEHSRLPQIATITVVQPPPPHVSGQYNVHLPSPTSPTLSSHGHNGSSRFHSPQAQQIPNYAPLSPEDRRALNTFKVVL